MDAKPSTHPIPDLKRESDSDAEDEHIAKKPRLDTKESPSVPPTRAGTPLSPFTEELFGDILDAEPPTHPVPGLNYWSDSEDEVEDEHVSKKLRLESEEPSSPSSPKSENISQTAVESPPTSPATAEDNLTTKKSTEADILPTNQLGTTKSKKRKTPHITTKEAIKVLLALQSAASAESETSLPDKKIPSKVTTKKAGKDQPASKSSASANGRTRLPDKKLPSKVATKKAGKDQPAPKSSTSAKARTRLPDKKKTSQSATEGIAQSTEDAAKASLPDEKTSESSAIKIAYPMFCSPTQKQLKSGGSFGGDGGVHTIENFVDDIREDPLALSTDETAFQALSKTPYFFEVRIDVSADFTKPASSPRAKKRVAIKTVELVRYFVPSHVTENRYIEIHAKDVSAGLNPSVARMGKWDGKVPYATYCCDLNGSCSHSKAEDGISHVTPRTITLLKNHLRGNTFARRVPKAVSGEWLVGGQSKEWGMSLAEVVWQLE